MTDGLPVVLLPGSATPAALTNPSLGQRARVWGLPLENSSSVGGAGMLGAPNPRTASFPYSVMPSAFRSHCRTLPRASSGRRLRMAGSVTGWKPLMVAPPKSTALPGCTERMTSGASAVPASAASRWIPLVTGYLPGASRISVPPGTLLAVVAACSAFSSEEKGFSLVPSPAAAPGRT